MLLEHQFVLTKEAQVQIHLLKQEYQILVEHELVLENKNEAVGIVFPLLPSCQQSVGEPLHFAMKLIQNRMKASIDWKERKSEPFCAIFENSNYFCKIAKSLHLPNFATSRS